MTDIYMKKERIYFVELPNNYYFFSLKHNINENIEKHNKYAPININKYYCYDSKTFFTRLKNIYKEINVNNDLFNLSEKKSIEIKIYIDKLINEIHKKILNNTCHDCKYSSYKNEHFDIHINSKKHNIMIKNTELEINKLKERIEELEKEKNKNSDSNINANSSNHNNIANHANNTTNSNNATNSNNTTINITINTVPFGKEDITNIPHKDMIKILTKSYNSIIEMIKYLHCNVNLPENHNIYVSNKKREETKTFDGHIWNTNKANIIIDELVENIIKYIEIIFYKCKELKEKNELDDPQNKFNDKFIKKYEDILDEEFDHVHEAKKSYSEILYILYDVKELINKNTILKSHYKKN